MPRAPMWPDEPGPYVVLIDASSDLEASMIHHYLDEIEPRVTEPMTRLRIPPSRRQHKFGSVDPAISERLHREDDPLCVPLRVVWLAGEHEGVRRVRVKDVLIPGDPRDPNIFLQHFIHTRHPDRIRIVMGAPARRSVIEKLWTEPSGRTVTDGTTLGEFVALRAWLALERAERNKRGLHYKVPKFLMEDLFWSRAFQAGVQRLARSERKPEKRMFQRTKRYLKEIAAQHSPYVIDIVNGITSAMIATAHQKVDYSPARLHEIYQLADEKPLVFLPSHKSNFDHLVFQHVLYENELPLNHTAGGINMNFFLIGPLLRRAGIFFIRREFKHNEPYKFVLKQYLDYLLEKRFALEWYIEGGRSRSGKLREPRLGLLAYVADSYQRGITDDVALVPVSIAYDQITDVAAYTAEQRGHKKEKESFAWAVKFISGLRSRHGNIYVRFGEPLLLSEHLNPTLDLSSDEGKLALPKLAFDVSTRINDVTPITPISLVTMALLSVGNKGVTASEAIEILEPFVAFVEDRNLPTSSPVSMAAPEQARAALEQLVVNGVVTRTDGLTHRIYSITRDQHLAAAYYRNTIIHFFIPVAIAELALALDFAFGEMLEDSIVARALALRDLLKFEFFFAPTDEFANEIRGEISRYRVGQATPGTPVRVDVDAMNPPKSPIVLRPFLEAYGVVAETLALAGDQKLEPTELAARCLLMGEQMYRHGRIRNAEAITTALYASGIQLVDNRNLLDATAEQREDFRAELEAIREALNSIDDLNR
ncbi:MAG: 1-acyl-sn-glycerol-3-phosphate acyltransferase [Acidimicrobiia bacterium]